MRLVVFLLWLLYFLQGIPYGFQTKFLPVFLRSYSISLALISFTRLLSLPWLLKPLWAPLVDKFGTKIVWIKCNLLGMGLCYLIASFISLRNVTLTVIVVGCLNIMAATQDIAVDSLFVDQLTSQEIGLGNIAQVVGYKAGSLFGGGFLGWLSSSYPWQQLFFFLFIMYTISAILMCSPLFINLTLPQVIQSKYLGKTPIYNEQSFKHVQPKLSCINLHEKCKNIKENNIKVAKQLSREISTSEHRAAITERTTSQNTMQNERIKHLNRDSRTSVTAKFGLLENYLNMYQIVLKSKDTKWTIVYVLIYKLGEQGIIAMLPMFLLDQGLSSSETAMLTGVLCQFCSIFGSLIGGILVSTYHWKGLHGKLAILSTIRLVVTCVLTWLASLNALKTNWIGFVIFDCLLHSISGMITTITFTLMVACSQKCVGNLSATHYSTLATFEVFGKLCMVSVSGTVVDMIGYINFFTFCTFLTLLPMILLRIANSFQDRKVWVND